MVLGRGHETGGPPVHEGEQARFFSLQKLLNHAPRTRLAEGALLHHLGDRRLGIVYIRCSYDALTRSKAVRLDGPGPAAIAHEPLRLRGVVEHTKVRCRNFRFLHQLFREGLARLEPGRRPARPEDGDALRFQPVGEAHRQRRLGPDDDEAGPFFFGEGGDALGVLGGDGYVPPEGGGPRVAGSADDVIGPRALSQLPGQGVLAPAPADDDDFHE